MSKVGDIELRTRRRAREAILQILYQCDTIGDWSEQSVEQYFTVFHQEDLDSEEKIVADSIGFIRQIVRGVHDNITIIDSKISAASTHWSLHRMSRVDRNLLRLAVYEICYRGDIPVNVSINEAIEIAKRYGCDDSRVFINGVLDQVAKSQVPVDQVPPVPEVLLKVAGID